MQKLEAELLEVLDCLAYGSMLSPELYGLETGMPCATNLDFKLVPYVSIIRQLWMCADLPSCDRMCLRGNSQQIPLAVSNHMQNPMLFQNVIF